MVDNWITLDLVTVDYGRYLADKQTSSLTETLFPVAMKNRLVHLTVASSIAF
mgnify:CR=1 FL=1